MPMYYGSHGTIGDYLTACTFSINGITPEIQEQILERIHSGKYLMISKDKLEKLQEKAGKFDVIKDLFKN